ncbi:MAG: hypothetical protein H7Z16_15555 [Pyrinomonadaceae bacterium]|nr:hypothetical protein [Pyrinomonadaceae bacterium]
MNLSSLKLPLKKSFLVLITTLVVLFIVEMALRQFSPKYYPIIPAAYEYDADLGFRLRPNAHLLKTTDFQQESVSNSLGTANFQENFEGYESLVFAVGDSHTQGTGLPADLSYPSQLDFILNQDDQGFYVKKFGVANLGVAGFGGEQSLIGLRRLGARLGPPAIILYLGCDNDFEDDLAFRSRDRQRIVIAGSPTWGFLTRPLRFVLEDTQLGLLARVSYRERVRARMVKEASKQSDRKLSVAELESPILAQMKAYAEEHNSKLIVSWSDEGESYQWLKSWATKQEIAFADWAPKANSVRATIPRLPLDNQHSGGHHRGWTNQVIAQEFARQIRARR